MYVFCNVLSHSVFKRARGLEETTTSRQALHIHSSFSKMMNVPCAFTLLLFGVLGVSYVATTCPQQGAALGCTCKNAYGSSALKVKCKNTAAITDIPTWLPNGTVSLELEHCDIRYLNKESFKNLPNLTHVKINRQRSYRLAFNDSLVFQGLSYLYHVELADNGIRSLPAGLLANLPSLVVVALEGNRGIVTLPNDLLENSTNLKILRIDRTGVRHDVIAKIGRGHFGTNITGLSMFDTYLQYVYNGLFSGLPKLTHLAISECRIEYIGEDVMKGTQVHTITFDKNPIKRVDENAFRGSIASSFECVDCQLSSDVAFNGFLKKMPRLIRINLRNNNLTYVPKDAFGGLKNLDIIDLSNNSIATIEENPYAKLPGCDSVHCVQLQLNPLLCNCSLAWLRNFADTLTGNKSSWKCAQPQDVSGKSLISLKAQEMCDTAGQGINNAQQYSISNAFLTLAAVMFYIAGI